MAGNRYSQPPPGKIWVPTPNGPVAMTLAEARLYQAAHRYAATDPQNPNLSPDVRAELQDPRIQAAIRAGQSTTVKINDTTYTIENGQVTGYSRGSLWKPIAAAALTAAGGVALGAVTGPGAAGAGGAGAGTGVTSGAASAVPASVLPATATVPTSMGTVAGLAGGTDFGTAAGTGAATGAGTGAAASALPATQTVPTATGTIGGVAPSGAVPAAMAPRSVGSVLGNVGSWLGTPGGGAAISAAGGLIGAGIESRGISKAAEIQAQTAREALAYAKQRDQYLQNLEAQRYGQFNARMQPYMNLGQSAGARMAQILGLDPSQFAPTQTWPGVTGSEMGAVQPDIRQRGSATPGGPTEGTAVPRPASAGQMITMRAPDGSTKAVPQEHVPFYQEAGAQVVG